MTQTVTYRTDTVPWKDEHLIFRTGPTIWGSSSSSAVTLPFRQVSQGYENEVPSIEETDVAISLLDQIALHAFAVVRRQIFQRSQEWVSKLEAAAVRDQVEVDLEVEKEIVLRMSPYARRMVRVHAKYTGQAKPKVVYDPLPEGEERSQE